VIARQSVWTDPEVKDLTAQFITATDEVGRLQSGSDPECLVPRRIHAGGIPMTMIGEVTGRGRSAGSGRSVLTCVGVHRPAELGQIRRRFLVGGLSKRAVFRCFPS
jgi:hypothetical protein